MNGTSVCAREQPKYSEASEEAMQEAATSLQTDARKVHRSKQGLPAMEDPSKPRATTSSLIELANVYSEKIFSWEKFKLTSSEKARAPLEDCTPAIACAICCR